jgi:hypothetical protein
LGVFFAESVESDAHKTFLDVTKAFDDVVFAHTLSADVASHYGAA